MAKQKYVKRRRERKRPWWEKAREQAEKWKQPQQWEQTLKKEEAEEYAKKES